MLRPAETALLTTVRRTVGWPAATVVVLPLVVGLWALFWDNPKLDLYAPPFAGHYGPRVGAWTVVPVIAGVLLYRRAPWLVTLPWGRFLVASTGAAVLWSVALALMDGPAALRDPLLPSGEYLHDVPRVDGFGSFLGGFTRTIAHGPHPWTTQVAGHPPLLLLVLAGLRAVGLGGPGPAAVLFVGVGCTAVAAVLVTVRSVVDEPTARACAPFVALAPAALWVAVSADALFMAVMAWGIALVAVRRGALAGGVVIGVALMLSYSVIPLGLLVLAVTRRVRPLFWASVGVLGVLGFFWYFGFYYPDGLDQTLVRVRAGDGGRRPYEYFLFANLAVLAVALGPAGVTALVARPRGALAWLVVPAAVAVGVSDLSGASRGEVERIWLPFVPWLLVATARLPQPRQWLGLQLVAGVVLDVVLRAKW